MKHDIKIGELAKRCGVSRDTVRFYERVGLLRNPLRTASRHRIYDREAVAQLRFIRGVQRLGLTLEDIRHLLRLREARGPDAGKRIVGLLRSRADAIDSEISKLLALRRLLDKSIKLCEGSPFGSFSVLERLALDPGSQG
ncbi:MAG: MerR family transcriptional regulator [Thermoanaerobaculia bacterium]